MNKQPRTSLPARAAFVLSSLLVLGGALFLGGCQALPAQQAAAQTVQDTPTATATALPRPTQQPSPTASPTPDPLAAPAAAALAYADALKSSDYAGAAALVSDFSLTVSGLTRGEIAKELSSAPHEYTPGAVALLDPTTALVEVSLENPAEDQPAAQTWAFRLENGRWMYNYHNLIDTRTLDVGVQTTSGITLGPRRMLRYTDRIVLELLAQNQTRSPMVFGQVNEILATFHFQSEAVEAATRRIVLEPLRSYPDVTIEVAGQFAEYPTSVDIRTWKDYQVEPWYSFDLTH